MNGATDKQIVTYSRAYTRRINKIDTHNNGSLHIKR